MTIVNSTLATHRHITEAIFRLQNAIVRHNVSVLEPHATELMAMFDDVNQKDEDAETRTISKLGPSGDLPRVSDELYNPSSNIFDTNTVTSVILAPYSTQFYETGASSGLSDINCSSVYIIKNEGKVFAEIKNYHTLQVINYSVTSVPYPVLNQDAMNVNGFLFGGRLGSPYTVESLDVVGQLFEISYPLTVIYTTYNNGVESMDVAGQLYSMVFPTEVIYSTYNNGIESLNSTGQLYAVSYPLTVAYIEYDLVTESLNSTGQLYAISFS